MNLVQDIIAEVNALKNPERAKKMSNYFQTFKGGYGFGDFFIGVSNPQLRSLCKKYKDDITLPALQILIQHKTHEIRLLVIFILVAQFEKSKRNPIQQQVLVDFYIKHLPFVNNWDLVDSSAYKILGVWLLNKNKDILINMAYSSNIWEQRVAMVSTLSFIKKNNFDLTFKLAEILLHHNQDIIHKAVGWMLKEVGKRDENALFFFLDQHLCNMPRVILRTSIEKIDAHKKQLYLNHKQ